MTGRPVSWRRISPNMTILKTKQRPDFRMSFTTRPPVFAPIRTRSRVLEEVRRPCMTRERESQRSPTASLTAATRDE